MAPGKSPAFKGRNPHFLLHAQEFSIRTQILTLKQVGRLITAACDAAIRGDRVFFDRYPFFSQPALFIGNPLYISPPVRRQVYDRDGRRCKHCSTTERLSIDHVIARANGGSDDIGNLQTLCMPCNRRKGVQ